MIVYKINNRLKKIKIK